MSTTTFTPDEIDQLPTDFRNTWAEALKTSKQYRGDWANEDCSELCCLGVALRTLGKEDGYIRSAEMRDADEVREVLNSAATMMAARDQDGTAYSFAALNDNFLTHVQIAELLEGKSVTVEDDSTQD